MKYLMRALSPFRKGILMVKFFLKGCCLAFLVFSLLFTSFFSAYATEESPILVSETIEQVGDGLYMTISVYEFHVNARSSTFEKIGNKEYVLRDQNGNALWTYTVRGIFTVKQGESAVCTASVGYYEIHNSAWYFNGANAYPSGNKAVADAEFYKKKLGVKIETEFCHVILTCDINGNLS